MILAVVLVVLAASGHAHAAQVVAARAVDVQCLVENAVMGAAALARDWVWGLLYVAYSAGEAVIETAVCTASSYDAGQVVACLRRGLDQGRQVGAKLVDLVVGRIHEALDYAKETLKCLQSDRQRPLLGIASAALVRD